MFAVDILPWQSRTTAMSPRRYLLRAVVPLAAFDARRDDILSLDPAPRMGDGDAVSLYRRLPHDWRAIREALESGQLAAFRPEVAALARELLYRLAPRTAVPEVVGRIGRVGPR